MAARALPDTQPMNNYMAEWGGTRRCIHCGIPFVIKQQGGSLFNVSSPRERDLSITANKSQRLRCMCLFCLRGWGPSNDKLRSKKERPSASKGNYLVAVKFTLF